MLVAGVVGEKADVPDIAVDLGVVHAVADDELVRNFEAYVVGLDGDEAALGLVEAAGDLERRGLVLEHQASQVGEGEAGVEDVFDEDDVTAFDGVVDVLDELDGSRGDAGAAVGGYGHEVEGVVDGNGSGEVREKNGCTFENANEDDGLAGGEICVVGGDLGADGGHALGNLLSAEEDVHVGCGWEGDSGCRADGHED
jgi:hypothetical protein